MEISDKLWTPPPSRLLTETKKVGFTCISIDSMELTEQKKLVAKENQYFVRMRKF